MKYVLILFMVFSLYGCGNAAEPDMPSAIDIQDPSHAPDVSFEDVLAQYQVLNQRLEDIAFRVQHANAALCPVTERSTGLTIHTLSDYPDNLQPVAATLLNVDSNLSLRTVRADSPAAKAGFLPGDRLARLNGSYIPSGPTARAFYAALSRRISGSDALEISVRRDEQTLTQTLRPDTICGYPAVLIFSEQINGHTNGEDVFITSELLRSLPDDVDVALIVAHEMAHAIAGHMQRAPSKSIELEADKMALIMLARAGYDISRAVDNWSNAPHPDDSDRPSSTHPSQIERLLHFEAVEADILSREAREQALNFE